MSILAKTLTQIIRPTYREILPAKFDSPEADVMLLAIGLQESRLVDRYQVIDRARPHIKGAARGLWQFEHGGGVIGVLQHLASARYAKAACAIRQVSTVSMDVYQALEHDDLLACAIARLLLWTDRAPLPPLGQEEAAWNYYLRNWRPGKPHRNTWGALYTQALDAVRN